MTDRRPEDVAEGDGAQAPIDVVTTAATDNFKSVSRAMSRPCLRQEEGLLPRLTHKNFRSGDAHNATAKTAVESMIERE